MEEVEVIKEDWIASTKALHDAVVEMNRVFFGSNNDEDE